MEFPERSLPVLHFSEPLLEFGSAQKAAHPKDGLFLYGPYLKSRKSRDVRIGVIGTQAGINHFRSWISALKKGVTVPAPTKGEKQDRLHLANFPGLEEAFQITIDESALVTLPLEWRNIDTASRLLNHHEAVKKVVSLYVGRVLRHLANDERAVDIWNLVIPELIYDRCRPQAKRAGLPMEKGDFGKKQKKRSDLPLLGGLVDHVSEEIFDDVPDFHRQIKAAFLAIAPTQILRETTLAPDAFVNKAGFAVRKMQDRATIAWNIATGLYYKTQPMPPWRLSGIRPGVCYVGLVFKNLPGDAPDHACCAAQMFLSEGDGVVFRGANGPWKTGDYEYHLKPEAAGSLIGKVLDTYRELKGAPPKELFIHGQASFEETEWRAFEQATPRETNIVGVRIKTTGGEMKLFRDGDYPALRGTALILDERNANLWTTGYVPQLDTYIGPETPNPLFITLLRSKLAPPKIETVLTDIMALTKINYNSCNYNDGLPVTVRFANMVGEVLTLGSAKGADRQTFKFYV
ncbi:hypothetical protein SAMN05444161_1427 [Rhizobiales bacterium GAS191]|nr:hypothetical protein SAMN05444161_1427 [Rhizobiales bacterium GAS191]